MNHYSTAHVKNNYMTRSSVLSESRRAYIHRKRKKQARLRRIRKGIIVAVIFCVVCLVGQMLYYTDSLLRLRLEWSGCPESIREFVEKYPESISFAENYKRYHDQDVPFTPNTQYETGEIPLLIQWDLHWGYKNYGHNFLGITGCGPTCLTMVYTGLTGDDTWNPADMAVWAEQQGYYVDGAGTAWAMMTDGAESFGLFSRQIGVSDTEIRKALQNGQPLICSMSPGDFTTSGHFIVLAGIYSDGSVKVNDPNSLKNSEKHWEITELTRQMKAAWSYTVQS